MTLKRNKLTLAITSALLLNSIGLADPLHQCRISPLVEHLVPQEEVKTDDILDVYARNGHYTKQYAELEGDIRATYDDKRIDATKLSYNIDDSLLSSDLPTRFSSPNLVVEGDSFSYNIDKKESSLGESTYFLSSLKGDAQGKARSVEHKENEEKTYLSHSTYTTCAVDNEIWRIEGSDILLDHAAGRGVAKGAKISILNTPIFYSPYLSFPIDDKRHSGFLLPSISMSRSSGFSLEVPYYFNIAPNMDLTLTGGLYTNRGIMLGSEFRYKNRWQEFALAGSFLKRDRHYDKRDRWSLSYDQTLTFTDKFTGEILYQKVSDDDYLEDFDNDIGLLSQTNLERYGKLLYKEKNWQLKLRFQDFQIVDHDAIPDKPYARMPQLTFDGEWYWNNFSYGIHAEAVHFRTDISSINPDRPRSANRFDIMPYVKYRLENSWGFFEPKVALRHTRYSDLKYDRHYSSKRSENLTRTLPIISVDSGLFFERKTNFDDLFGGGSFTQTLEPRLYYLYVPYRNQSKLPIFDSSYLTPSYASLFKSNSFLGADRQSNANQITTALTTRFLNNETGEEKFALSFGRTFYFKDPRITLGKDLSQEEAKKRRAEWFVEANTEIFNNLYTDVTWQWSPKAKKTTRATLDLRYQPSDRKIINIGYRYNRNLDQYTGSPKYPIEQIDFTSFWAINSKWAVVGRYNYSIESSRMIDTYAGFEYGDCCMNTRVVARYYRDNPTRDEKKWKVYLQFEFKGLGNFGQNASGLWDETITGYNRNRALF